MIGSTAVNLDGPGITWGAFALILNGVVESYDELVPPPELAAYHSANLASLRTVSGAAQARSGGDSFSDEVEAFAEAVFEELFAIAFDTTRTEEEQERAAEELLGRGWNELFRQDVWTSGYAAIEALAALPPATQSALEGEECVPLFYVSATAGATTEPPPTLETIPTPGTVPGGAPAGADDHGNNIGDATAVTVGGSVQGNLDYDGDGDVFVFEARAGVSYQIEVALGTLEDSTLVLLGADGWNLAENDDYGDSQASRIIWRATNAGDYYVEVAAWGSTGTGGYTLTIAVSNIVDDHGNNISDATAVTVGRSVQGNLDYDGDGDVFAFEAREGVLYQIDAALGTLNDSTLALLGADGWDLAYNDDYGESWASRITWRAPSSGEYYVAVEGFGPGTYTLTIAVSNIVDDHGDDIGDATAVTVGGSVQGSLDYDGDGDVFVFGARAGVSYQIDVALGTLEDSTLVLLGADGWELAYNDDYGNSLASRITWRAPSSGEYYVAVEGFGPGTYTLTVALSAP